MFCIMTGVVVTLLCIFPITHQTVNIKVVNFIICKLHLNKADDKKEASPIYKQEQF